MTDTESKIVDTVLLSALAIGLISSGLWPYCPYLLISLYASSVLTFLAYVICLDEHFEASLLYTIAIIALIPSLIWPPLATIPISLSGCTLVAERYYRKRPASLEEEGKTYARIAVANIGIWSVAHTYLGIYFFWRKEPWLINGIADIIGVY